MKIKIRNNRIYFSNPNYWLFFSISNIYISNFVKGLGQNRYEFYKGDENKTVLIFGFLSGQKIYIK